MKGANLVEIFHWSAAAAAAAAVVVVVVIEVVVVVVDVVMWQLAILSSCWGSLMLPKIWLGSEPDKIVEANLSYVELE